MKLAELGEHENLPYNLQADTTVLQYKAIMDEYNLINCTCMNVCMVKIN